MASAAIVWWRLDLDEGTRAVLSVSTAMACHSRRDSLHKAGIVDQVERGEVESEHGPVRQDRWAFCSKIGMMKIAKLRTTLEKQGLKSTGERTLLGIPHTEPSFRV